ncbi:MAG: acyltransferase family protein [Lachnospiraceae bacterium]|nr:acyltransferase family protein [Lachnospiraceae bacterium]
MQKRLDYFDMAKGIGVILVLLGHLQGDQFFVYSPYILPMCEWIFSFHMPLFFIISGMLIFHKKDEDKDLNVLIKKRFKGIMVPYFWFSLCYMSVVLYAFFSGTIYPETVFVNLWYVLGMYGMNVLWFLPTLFAAEIIFIFVVKKSKEKAKGNIRKAYILLIVKTVLIAAIGLLMAYYMTTLSYDDSVSKRVHEFVTVLMRPTVAMSFIAIGYFAQMLLISKDYMKKLTPFVGIVLMVVAALFVKINHGVDFRSMVFKNVFFYYFCAVLSSIGLILICKGIKPVKIIKFYGVNSLIFMAVHNSESILYLGMNLAMYANQFLTHARGYICYAIIVTVILIYVAVMIILINRFVPFIVGKPFHNPFKKQEISG